MCALFDQPAMLSIVRGPNMRATGEALNAGSWWRGHLARVFAPEFAQIRRRFIPVSVSTVFHIGRGVRVTAADCTTSRKREIESAFSVQSFASPKKSIE
jgi:hypothetical protein